MMRKYFICMGAAFVAAAAFGVTLDELNIARDPETLDAVIYGTTVSDRNLLAGPDKNFAVLAAVPAGTEVPVLGWMTDYVRKRGFWIRTEYSGLKGWLQAYEDGRRLIERDGGPLFPMEVKAAELRFNYNEEGTTYPYYEKWLHKGDKLEFASLWGESWLKASADDIDFWVRKDNEWGYVRAYATEDRAENRYKPFVKEGPGVKPAGWFVEFPPEFLELNFDYNYDDYDFEFADGAAYRDYYLGPGFEFPRAQEVFLTGGVFFVEGRWGLVPSWNDWGWVYLGTEEEPNVTLTTVLARGVCPVPDNRGEEKVYAGLNIGVTRDCWPSDRRVCFTLHAPYFCDYKEEGRVDAVDIYQPPESDVPVFSAPAGEGVADWWHETYLLEYELTLPESVDTGAPFRAVAHMHYDGAQDFQMEFLCNADE